MNLSAHLATLRSKHLQLKSKIQDAFIHHLPDNEVTKLKKKKLRVKEEITQCEQQEKQLHRERIINVA